MPSTKSPDTGHDDPTQYAYLSDTSVKAYSEMPGLAEPDRHSVPEVYPEGQKWSRVIAIAALGLLAAFLLALLTLHVVRADEPGATTPSGVVTESVTVMPEHPADPTGSSSSPVKKSVTIPDPPPATMTNPLPTATTTVTITNPTATTTVTIPEPPPATMTNPLEPPATMTNPLEPPATMTNPLEPPATMTNPMEPPVGETHTQAE